MWTGACANSVRIKYSSLSEWSKVIIFTIATIFHHVYQTFFLYAILSSEAMWTLHCSRLAQPLFPYHRRSEKEKGCCNLSMNPNHPPCSREIFATFSPPPKCSAYNYFPALLAQWRLKCLVFTQKPSRIPNGARTSTLVNFLESCSCLHSDGAHQTSQCYRWSLQVAQCYKMHLYSFNTQVVRTLSSTGGGKCWRTLNVFTALSWNNSIEDKV